MPNSQGAKFGGLLDVEQTSTCGRNQSLIYVLVSISETDQNQADQALIRLFNKGIQFC